MIAAIACLLLTPVAMRLAPRVGLVDRPGPLKLHDAPVPLAGLAVSAALTIAVAASGVPGWPWVALSVAIAALAGTIDDVRPIPPASRLALQLAAGVALLLSGGGLEPLGLLAGVGLVVAVVATANAVNMVDGQDGLAPGLVAIAALGLAALGGGGGGTSLAAAGAAAAFLLWNRPPARAFLGDAGCYALGVALAAGASDASAAGWPGLLAAGACLGVLAYELTSTIVRRFADRTSALAGDRRHSYDRLADRVGSRAASTYLMWLAGALAAAIGLAIVRAPVIVGLAAEAAALAIAASIHVRLATPIREGER